jgi:ATP-dependent Clp endopeptidase proteolytic subunit ClpP
MFDYNTDTKEIFIYDEIGPAYWGLIDAAMIASALSEIGDGDITVRLNTPGGSVDEGIAIYNALKRHKGTVTTVVDSLAASMGSYLLQAGSNRIVAANAMVMIHDPWSIAMGNSKELRKTADVLDKYAVRMVPDYALRSGKTDDEIKSIMAEETWYAGAEIVDAGFADSMSDASDVEASVAGLRRVAAKIPAALAAKIDSQEADKKKWFARREQARKQCLKLSQIKEVSASKLKHELSYMN